MPSRSHRGRLHFDVASDIYTIKMIFCEAARSGLDFDEDNMILSILKQFIFPARF